MVVVQLRTSDGYKEAETGLTNENGSKAQAFIKNDNWLYVLFTGSNKVQMTAFKNDGQAPASMQYQFSPWYESVNIAVPGPDGDDIFIGSRALIDGQSWMTISLNNFVVKVFSTNVVMVMTIYVDLFATGRSWSFKSSQPHTPQSFNFLSENAEQSHLGGIGSILEGTALSILFYKFQVTRQLKDYTLSMLSVNEDLRYYPWTPKYSNFYLYQESTEPLLGIDSFLTSVHEQQALIVNQATNQLFILTVTYTQDNINPNLYINVLTQKRIISSPTFASSNIMQGKIISANEFYISGTIQSMSGCGVSFGSGNGLGFIAKSTDIESCIPYKFETLTQSQPQSLLTINFIKLSSDFEAGFPYFREVYISIYSVDIANFKTSPTKCCFTILPPTIAKAPKYIIGDSPLLFGFPDFTIAEVCTDMSISMSYSSTFKHPVTGLQDNLPNTFLSVDLDNPPVFTASTSDQTKVFIYDITVKATIFNGLYNSMTFKYYFMSDYSVIAEQIDDIEFIVGYNQKSIEFIPFATAKPSYTIKYYLSNQDGTSYDSSIITFADGQSDTQIKIYSNDNSKKGIYKLQMTGILDQDTNVQDKSLFQLQILDQCYGTSIKQSSSIIDKTFLLTEPKSQDLIFKFEPWTETLGKCNQFTYDVSTLPSYITFDKKLLQFTVTHDMNIIEGRQTIYVTGYLPWSQTLSISFNLQVLCKIGKIIAPSIGMISSMEYSIGTYFTQILPQFTYLPKDCAPELTYQIFQDVHTNSPSSVPKFIKLEQIIDENDNILPAIVIDRYLEQSEIGNLYNILVKAKSSKDSTIFAEYNQLLRITNDGMGTGSQSDNSAFEMSKDYYEIIVDKSKGINQITDIGCEKEYKKYIATASTVTDCSLKFILDPASLFKVSGFNPEILIIKENTIRASPLATKDSVYVITFENPLGPRFQINVKIKGDDPVANTTNINPDAQEYVKEQEKKNGAKKTTKKYSDKPLSAKIKSISQYGLIRIDFSKNLLITNETNITSKALKIEVFKIDSSFQPVVNNTNLTWNIESFTSKSLYIQMEFQDPYSISLQGEDEISVTILKPEYFQTPFYGRILEQIEVELIKKNYVVKKIIPMQMSKNNQLIKMVQMLQTTISANIYGNSMINLVLSTSLQTIWGMINTIQLVTLLPLVNIYFPANAQMIFDILTHIFNFEFFDMTPYLTKALQIEDSEIDEVLSGPFTPSFDSYDIF